MKTVLELTPEEKQTYRPLRFIEERESVRNRELDFRLRNAQDIAQIAAMLLKAKFGARRVLLFGSVVRASAFTRWSDIDLAVSGIAANEFYFAVAAISGLSPDFRIDLVDYDACDASLRLYIERDGAEL